jgi:very-short-patch-repair endonuclease
MRQLDGTAETKCDEIATQQHGLVTRRQLIEAGVTPSMIRTRLTSGSLLQEHPGVYRVGHRAPSTEATYLAAVLACGDDALLCGKAAAHLYGLLRSSAPPSPEIVAPTKRLIEEVGVRRSRVSLSADRFVFHGIPVTSVPRTIVDLAAHLSLADLARACHEAGVRYRTTPADVHEVLQRRTSTRGARKLRRVLHGEVRVTLSALESRFLRLLAANGLPLPVTNRVVGSKRVDCRWPDRRLTVELDSYRYHSSRHAWEQDRLREREVRARGDRIERFTYGDVYGDPAPMLRELVTLLSGNPSCLSVHDSSMGLPHVRCSGIGAPERRWTETA